MLKNKSLIIINCGMLLIFFLWNYWQPLTADDYGYSFSNVLHSNNLFTILHYRYFHWDGRLSADTLVLTLLSQNTLKYVLPIINFANALTLVGILNLIYQFIYAKQYNMHKYLLASVTYVLFFIAIGNFAQDFLWKTVAIQYAWGFLLVLATLWRFYLDLYSSKTKSSIQLFLYLMAGFFIGLYSEIYVAFVVDVYLSAIIIWYVFKKPLTQLLKPQYTIFFISTILGGIILIIAPGNFIHQGYYLTDNHIVASSYSVLDKILMTYVQFFRYGYHVVVAIILAYVAYWVVKNRLSLPSPDVEYISFLLILLNIHILSFVGIAYYSPIAGRMLIFMDSIIFVLLFKFACLKRGLAQSSKGVILKSRCVTYIGLIGVVIVVSAAYYNLHRFIILRQQYIQQNPQSNTLPTYANNSVFKYIVYFDSRRTADADFRKLYLSTQLN